MELTQTVDSGEKNRYCVSKKQNEEDGSTMKVPQVHVYFYFSNQAILIHYLLNLTAVALKFILSTKFLIGTKISEMTDVSVLVKRENGHTDLGDKAAMAVSPCEEIDIGDN